MEYLNLYIIYLSELNSHSEVIVKALENSTTKFINLENRKFLNASNYKSVVVVATSFQANNN